MNSWWETYEGSSFNGKPVATVSPPGWSGAAPLNAKKKPVDLESVKIKKAWEISYSPAKSIPMNLIMNYFTPNSLQIIPIMMTLSLFTNPVKEMLSLGQKFRDVERNAKLPLVDLYMMKLVFILCCLGNVAVGVWKLRNMGVIPNKSDWLSWDVPFHFQELFIH